MTKIDAKGREALRAAHVLREYCKAQQCYGCPMEAHDTDCINVPRNWKLPELEEAPKERRLVEIKTVQSLVDAAAKFDKDVNAALAEGWTLVKRYTNAPSGTHRASTLIAELERYEND